jgi:hypothetical protein
LTAAQIARSVLPMPSGALRALLTRSIDYAGMFPPCSLDLEPALQKQAAYVRDADSWMLSTFVLPIAQFGNAAAHLSLFDAKHPLRISALGPKTNSADEFGAKIKEVAEAIRVFAKEHVDLVSIDQLEMPLVGDLPRIDLNMATFWEAPEQRIAAIASAKIDKYGFKLRTGGVTAEAFPTSAQIAKALVAAAKHRVPIKFTAGLHHPIRMFRDEVKTKMHGFLNVLGAGVLAFEHGWDEAQTTAMLDDEDAKSFSFDDKRFAWREWKIDIDRIEAHRKFVTSFGSCSFEEPREDLRALNLL